MKENVGCTTSYCGCRLEYVLKSAGLRWGWRLWVLRLTGVVEDYTHSYKSEWMIDLLRPVGWTQLDSWLLLWDRERCAVLSLNLSYNRPICKCHGYFTAIVQALWWQKNTANKWRKTKNLWLDIRSKDKRFLVVSLDVRILRSEMTFIFIEYHHQICDD